MPKNFRSFSGLLITLLISLAVMFAFYGNLPGKLNQVSYASGGDGLQTYITMAYHIKYDTSYMRTNAMNYPYGEHVFFTSIQPVFSNTVKFISENIVDISDYTIGMLNFLLLFFLFVTPLILYLIFAHFGVGTIISIIASVGITFLSPQLDRFGGHFNLSYVSAIPWMILLLIKFFRRPSVLLSILIFVTMLTGALTHFYLYGFFAVLMLFFYGAELIKKQAFTNNMVLAIHFVVQLILPFLILQMFYIGDHVTDRPGYPWGFMYYRAFPQSIFLPIGKPYAGWITSNVDVSFIDWEGFAFVGTVALIGTLVFLFRFFSKLFRKKYALLWQVTDNRNMNIMFWAGLAGLLYSFGIPFILGLEWLVDLIGPVRQMRGIARFSWIFFYVINIVCIYSLWTWWKAQGNKTLKIIVVLAALGMLSLDAWINVRNKGKSLENNIPALTDRGLNLPENQWIKNTDLSSYQAFIPLPYFHIGSENIWIDGKCDIVNQSFITIKNAGLPCMGVMLSRTSLSQTVENITLLLGPPCDALHTKRFPSGKPFLLMAARCELLTEPELQLIQHATMIDSSGNYYIYTLPFEAFRKIADSLATVMANEYSGLPLSAPQSSFVSYPAGKFHLNTFDSVNNNSGIRGTGGYSGIARDRNILFSGNLPLTDTSRTFIISFWLKNIATDLYPRSMVTLSEMDSLDQEIQSVTHPVSKKIVSIRQGHALIELTFRMIDPSNRLRVVIRNGMLKKKKLWVDDLLIRPEGTDVYSDQTNGIWKNNREFTICNQKH